MNMSIESGLKRLYELKQEAVSASMEPPDWTLCKAKRDEAYELADQIDKAISEHPMKPEDKVLHWNTVESLAASANLPLKLCEPADDNWVSKHKPKQKLKI